MNIVVMSPHDNKTGNTTVASVIAMRLAMKGRKTILTNVAGSSDSLMTYFGYNKKDGESKINAHRLVQMLKDGVIKTEYVDDYCYTIADNYSMFVGDPKDELDDSERAFITSHIMQYFPHEFKVIDFDAPVESIKNETEQNVLKRADLVVLVVEPNIQSLKKFKTTMNQIQDDTKHVPIFVVVNKYCNVIESVKSIASYSGIKSPNRWLTLRYNPYIAWGSNNGRMAEVFKFMGTSDTRVFDVAQDAGNIVNAILRLKVAKRQAVMKAQHEEDKPKSK